MGSLVRGFTSYQRVACLPPHTRTEQLDPMSGACEERDPRDEPPSSDDDSDEPHSSVDDDTVKEIDLTPFDLRFEAECRVRACRVLEKLDGPRTPVRTCDRCARVSVLILLVHRVSDVSSFYTLLNKCHYLCRCRPRVLCVHTHLR